MTHTPGKWIASCDDDESEESNVVTADGVVICRLEDAPEIRTRHNRGKIERPGSTAGADSLDEVDANAKLIAAAPDMLRALRAIVSDCREVLEGREPFDMALMHGIVYGLARAAIAKAEGR